MKLSASEVFQRLSKVYRPPRTFLNHKTSLDLLIATILSARCTDVQVNKVTPALFRKYRKAADYVRVLRADLERDIRSCGTYRTKAKHIQELRETLIAKHKGKVPSTMEQLTALPGIGRKTAAIILSVAFSKNEGIACDTHVIRLSRRLRLTREKSQGKIEIDLMEALPRKHWGRFNPLLISHGRAVCTAKKRKCWACIFKNECQSSLVKVSRDLAKS